MSTFFGTKKISAALLITALIFIQLAVPFSAAHAQFFVPVLTNLPGVGLASMDTLKKYVLDLAARIVAATLIQAITNQIVGWIQGNGGENVGFVSNLDQSFRKEMNLAGGEFLNNLSGINLCTANLRGFLQINLRSPGINKQLGCTLQNIGANAERFFKNFNDGGWPAFLKIGMEPQNNPHGAYLIALDSKLRLEDSAGKRVELGVQAGKGFLGGRASTRKCERNVIRDADVDGNEFDRETTTCHTEYNTSTPGGLVADTLSKAVGSGIDFAVVADEIQEAIASIVSALINRMISETYSAISSDTGEEVSGEGIFDERISRTPFGAEELEGHRIYQQTATIIFTADAAVSAVNGSIIATHRDLISKRTQIYAILRSIAELRAKDPSETDPDIQEQIHDLEAQLPPLRASETELAQRLATIINQQNNVLRSEIELTGIQRTLINARSAEDIIRAANSLEQAINRLSAATEQIQDIPRAITATGNIRADTVSELANATRNVRDELTIFQQILDFVDLRIASSVTSLETKEALQNARPGIVSQIERLNTSQSELTTVNNDLTAAVSDEQIKAMRRDAVEKIVRANEEMKKASDLMNIIKSTLGRP